MERTGPARAIGMQRAVIGLLRKTPEIGRRIKKFNLSLEIDIRLADWTS